MVKNPKQAINVYPSKRKLSHKKLLDYVNDKTNEKYLSLSDLRTGIPYITMLNQIYPGVIHMDNVTRKYILSDPECRDNFIQLKNGLAQLGIHKMLDVEELCKGSQNSHAKFLKWFKKFIDTNEDLKLNGENDNLFEDSKSAAAEEGLESIDKNEDVDEFGNFVTMIEDANSIQVRKAQTSHNLAGSQLTIAQLQYEKIAKELEKAEEALKRANLSFKRAGCCERYWECMCGLTKYRKKLKKDVKNKRDELERAEMNLKHSEVLATISKKNITEALLKEKSLINHY